jgi:Poxvirus A22 protein
MIIVSFDIGIKNLAYTIIQYNPQEVTNNIFEQLNIQEWHKIDLQCSKYNLDMITCNLLEVLDNITYSEIEDIHNEDVHVVIENQPALKSPTMKSIQIIIYTYFNTISKYNSLSLNTKLISAKSKIKYIESFTEFSTYMNDEALRFAKEHEAGRMKRIPKEKQGYAKNKDDSVQFTRWLFKNIIIDDKHQCELEQLKKKDDVCDSFLQGLYYISKLH